MFAPTEPSGDGGEWIRWQSQRGETAVPTWAKRAGARGSLMGRSLGQRGRPKQKLLNEPPRLQTIHVWNSCIYLIYDPKIM